MLSYLHAILEVKSMKNSMVYTDIVKFVYCIVLDSFKKIDINVYLFEVLYFYFKER